MRLPSFRGMVMVCLYLVLVLVLLDVIYVAATLSDKPPFDPRSFIHDPVIGWKHRPNYGFERDMTDLRGQNYHISYSTHSNGFRSFPAHKTLGDTAKTLLVVGDSFTQALDVSDDKTYFYHIGQNSGWRVYAYGMGGYSTLQEYMMIDRYLDSVQPDLVLLQFCSNDYMDNHLSLLRESRGLFGGWRPYLNLLGKIYYDYPLTRWDTFVGKTLLAKQILTREGWLRQTFGQRVRYCEEMIPAFGKDYQPYAESLAITKMILEKTQQRLGSIPLVVFCADRFQPQMQDLGNICQELGIPFIPFPVRKMIPDGSKQEHYAHDTWHWNEAGHKLMGDYITENLSKIPLN